MGLYRHRIAVEGREEAVTSPYDPDEQRTDPVPPPEPTSEVPAPPAAPSPWPPPPPWSAVGGASWSGASAPPYGRDVPPRWGDPRPPGGQTPPYGPDAYSPGPYSAGGSPYGAGPYSAGPYSAGPYSAGPYSAGPYSAGAPPYGGPPAGGPGGSSPYSGNFPYGGGGAIPVYGRSPDPRRAGRGIVVVVMAVLVLVSAVAGGAVEYALGNNGSALSGSGVTNPGGSAVVTPNIDTGAIAAKVDPAIVDIDSTLAGGGEAAGTGMVVTSSGEVMTNNHVIEDSTSLTVQIPTTGQSYRATVLGDDPTDDVALIQLQGASHLKSIDVGSDSTVAVGTVIVCVGNALGRGGQPSAVPGTVTGVDQTITAGDPGTTPETLHGLIQTDAPIQRGDSGGPLVETNGHVIGMDTAAADGATEDAGASEAYSIPLTTALPILAAIRAGAWTSTVEIGAHRPLLGVEIENASGQSSSGSPFGAGGYTGPVAPVSSGALVVTVENPSPAQGAGLTPGDVIVSVDGSSVTSASSLESTLLMHRPGSSVTVKWVAVSGANHSSSVRLTSGPPA